MTHRMNTVTVTQQHTTITAYKPTLQTKHFIIQEALEFDLWGISQRVRLITTLFNVDLWLSGATHYSNLCLQGVDRESFYCAAVLPPYT